MLFHSVLSSQEITSYTAPSAATTSVLEALIVATDLLLDDALPTGVQDLLVAGVLTRV